jgi:acyl dehydratase
MARRYFEDCSVGDRVVTPGRTITETDVVTFAGFTGDWTALHTDAESAAEGPYGERIAHGMLVLAVGSGLLIKPGEAGILPDEVLALYKLERVRFRAPTKLGDTIRAEAEVTEVRELDPDRGLITVKAEIKNQVGEKVVTFKMQAVVGRRPE